MKTYLHSRLTRRGASVILFLTREGPRSDYGYWLGVYHDLNKSRGDRGAPYNGEGYEYKSIHEQRISARAYKVLLRDAHNEERINK